MKEDGWESRMENIEELQTFASKMALRNSSSLERDEEPQEGTETPLRTFLEEAMLSTDADETADKDQSSVRLLSLFLRTR